MIRGLERKSNMTSTRRDERTEKCAQVVESSSISQGWTGYKWIRSTVYSGLPPLAFSAGHEPSGMPIYVGRAEHGGYTFPVKIVPEKQSAHLTINGAKIFKKDYEILCGTGFRWVRSGKGHIPSNAVSCQKKAKQSWWYIGRANHGEGLIPGKVDTSEGCLFIPTEVGEMSYLYYDVLVHDQDKPSAERFDADVRGQWIQAANIDPIPAGAVRAGHDSDGTVIYVGRVNHEGNMIPAKIIPEKNMAHTQHEGKEFGKPVYEALCNARVAWKRFWGTIPKDAVSSGRLANDEIVYIGRGRYKGSLTPGKVLQSSKKLFIPFEWSEVQIDEFEILVYDKHADHDELDDQSSDSDNCSKYWKTLDEEKTPKKKLTWLPNKNSQHPPEGAVLAGYDSDQSPIYVGRVLYEGNQLPAKVIPRKNMCHTQHNGEEIEMITYEALCHGDVSWVKFQGIIPSNALVCGHTIPGEAVYVGRGCHLGSLTPGKVLHSHKVLYIPFGWKEIRITDFEILVNNDTEVQTTTKTLEWRHTKLEQPAPSGAIQAGKDSDGCPIYVGRVQHDGNRFVGKVIPNKQICDTIDENGKVISKLSYEALCDAEVSWVKFKGSIPTEAVECGRDRHGGKVFIGRCHHKSELIPGTVLEAEKKLRFVADGEMKVEPQFEILVHCYS